MPIYSCSTIAFNDSQEVFQFSFINSLYSCKFYNVDCIWDMKLHQPLDQIPPGSAPRWPFWQARICLRLQSHGFSQLKEIWIIMKSSIIYDCISKANVVHLKVIAVFILVTFKCLKYFKQACLITSVKHSEKFQKAWLKLPIVHITDFKKKTKWKLNQGSI